MTTVAGHYHLLRVADRRYTLLFEFGRMEQASRERAYAMLTDHDGDWPGVYLCTDPDHRLFNATLMIREHK